MKPFCNDLKITMQEYQKEIDEHEITDEQTLRSNAAVVDAFGMLCTSRVKPDCKDLQFAANNWREEIDKYSNLDIAKGKFPVIPAFGWIQGKDKKYYQRVQDGIDAALKETGCGLH